MTKTNVRLYIEGFDDTEEPFVLPPTQAHYLIHVMRCGVGDLVRIFHEQVGEWDARILEVSKNHVVVHAHQYVRPPEVSQKGIHLVCAPLRQHRGDMLLEKACELGITRFTPILTDHTQVRHISPDRLRKIAVESIEQSERLKVPHLDPLQSLDTFLEAQNTPLWVAWERHDRALPLWEAVQTQDQHMAVWIVGPEGGWSAREQTCFLAHPHIRPVSLGPSILRAETAALTIVSVWNSWNQRHMTS